VSPASAKGDSYPRAMDPVVVVAEFTDAWEARMARDSLAHAGIEAWLRGALPGERPGGLQLLVAPDVAEEARGMLEEMEASEAPLARRRPLWVPVVAALVVVGLVWAAVPGFLWPWIFLVLFVGFLLWRVAAPRRPPG
jgi:hypothetical protein